MAGEHGSASRDAFGGSWGGCIVPHLHVSVCPGWAISVRSKCLWRPKMPSIPDWRSTAAYAYLNELDPAQLAWEFLRRNPAYKRDYRTAIRRLARGHTDAFSSRWGLRFPFRSAAASRRCSAGLASAGRSRCRSSRAGARGVHRRLQHRRYRAGISAPCRRRRILDRRKR